MFRQLVQSFLVSSLRTAGCAALEHDSKIFKGGAFLPWADTSAGHADRITLFKVSLFLVTELVKGSLHRIGTNTVPENVRIVPAIVTGNILARFLAVLILHRRIERNTTAVLSCNGQILGGSFFGAVLLGGVFGNDFLCALAGIVVKPSNATSGFVFIQRFEWACFFLSAAIQKCVTYEVMGVCQKVCALVGNVIL